MLTYTKFDTFVENLMNKVHDLFGTAGAGADSTKVALSNTAPNAATAAVLADITQISGVNGYTTGGAATGNVGSRSGGTVTLTGTNVTWTASGGAIGPFQYVVHYNDTPTSPADPLINYWDRGAALTLQDGESYTVKFNNGASSGTIFTLA